MPEWARARRQPPPPVRVAAVVGGVERHGSRKGKEHASSAGASSSGAAGRSTTTATDVEVVTQGGLQMKVTGAIRDPWSHGTHYGAGFKCGYRIVSNKGGGVTRLREHLACIQGNVVPCRNVPLNIKELMFNEDSFKKTRSRVNNEHKHFVERELTQVRRGFGMAGRVIPPDEAGQIAMAMRESLRDVEFQGGSSSPFGSGAASCSPHQTTLDKFIRSPQSASNVPFDIDLGRSRAQAQPWVDIMLMGDARERLGKALAKWFHANDIPGRKADCPYFRAAIKLAQQLGERVPTWDRNRRTIVVYEL